MRVGVSLPSVTLCDQVSKSETTRRLKPKAKKKYEEDKIHSLRADGSHAENE